MVRCSLVGGWNQTHTQLYTPQLSLWIEGEKFNEINNVMVAENCLAWVNCPRFLWQHEWEPPRRTRHAIKTSQTDVKIGLNCDYLRKSACHWEDYLPRRWFLLSKYSVSRGQAAQVPFCKGRQWNEATIWATVSGRSWKGLQKCTLISVIHLSYLES